jgi:hypothetical protein
VQSRKKSNIHRSSLKWELQFNKQWWRENDN